jgi:predicted nucleic acid-binding protein
MALFRRGMSFMFAIDTNIWIYSQDKRDLLKQSVALELIATTRPFVLPWQVGCEFVAASRKLAAFGLTEQHAWECLGAMESMSNAILLPRSSQWLLGRQLKAKYMISYWDAMLAAACIDGNVSVLYSEDFGGSSFIERMKIVNPFARPG